MIADYILGFMSLRQRRKMQRRMESDLGLRAAVDEWQATLGPLNQLSDPVTPPDEIWHAVQARIIEAGVNGRAGRGTSPSWGGWLWGGGAGLAMAALAAILIWVSPRTLYQAELQATSPQSAPMAEAKADSHNDLVIGKATLPPIGADKSLELWIIPVGGTPRSLGILPAGGSYRIHLADLPPGATLAISLEPRGGSPSGAPTGPVIAAGKLHAL